MRRPLLLLACSVAFSTVLARTATDAAQEAYANGDHAAALAIYDSIAQQQTSAALLYNIGNCYSKLNDLPRSILFYERALRMAPGAEDIQANLDLARTRTMDRISTVPAFTLGSAWDRVRGGKDADQWARRSLWLCLITCTIAAGALLSTTAPVRRTLGALALVGGLFTATGIGLAAYRVMEMNDHDGAIIMVPKVDVKSEPNGNGTTLFVIHAGTKVRVVQEANGWYEVKLANGSVGWAPPTSLERI